MKWRDTEEKELFYIHCVLPPLKTKRLEFDTKEVNSSLSYIHLLKYL